MNIKTEMCPETPDILSAAGLDVAALNYTVTLLCDNRQRKCDTLHPIASQCFCEYVQSYRIVSRCGLAVRRLAGQQKDLASIRCGSPFSSLQKIVVHGHCLVTLPTPLMKH